MAQLSVLTWNVHGFADGKGQPRFDDAVALLAGADPDVIALQEAPRDATEELARRLDRHVVYAPAVWLGCALLGRVPWRAPQALTLHVAGGEARSAAWGWSVIGADEVGAVVTHLDHRREAVRVAQADQLLAALPPSIELLVGDLNAIDLDDLTTTRRLELDRVRAFRRWEPLAGDVLQRFRRDGFEDVVSVHLRDRPTASTSRADIRIDHVLARGPRLRSRAAAIVDTDASDHRPVQVELMVAGR